MNESSEWDGDSFLGQNIMHKEVDSFLIVVSYNVFSSLPELLAFIVTSEVSGMVVEGLFHSDSFFLLEEGIGLFFELFVISRMMVIDTGIGG